MRSCCSTDNGDNIPWILKTRARYAGKLHDRNGASIRACEPRMGQMWRRVQLESTRTDRVRCGCSKKRSSTARGVWYNYFQEAWVRHGAALCWIRRDRGSRGCPEEPGLQADEPRTAWSRMGCVYHEEGSRQPEVTPLTSCWGGCERGRR